MDVRPNTAGVYLGLDNLVLRYNLDKLIVYILQYNFLLRYNLDKLIVYILQYNFFTVELLIANTQK